MTEFSGFPGTIPERMYLLAHDLDRERMTARGRLGLVLRAAALADLLLGGHITDDGGRPAVAGRPRPGDTPGDPYLDAVLAEIAERGRRSWQRWIATKDARAVRAVRDRLETTGVIRVEPRFLLPDRIRVRDRRALKRYAAVVRAALRRPAGQADPRDEAALALALAGDLRTVASRSDRRQHRDRVRALTGEPIPRALTRALRNRNAAMGGG